MPRGRRWPERDEDALRRLYAVHGPAWPGWEAELSQPYGANAIAQHASALGLTAPRRWTPEDDRILALEVARVCRRLRKTPLAVAHRVEHLVARAKRGRS